MGDDVIVHSSDDNAPIEEVAEAIEQVAEQEQSFELGKLVGEIHALEEKVEYHDALIQLHSHDGLSTQDDTALLVAESESRIQSLVDKAENQLEQASIEGEPEIEAEPNEEEAEQAEEESNEDEPPKSRANRRPWAERYYSSSGHKL